MFTSESEVTALENRIEVLETENRHLQERTVRTEESLRKQLKDLSAENDTLTKSLQSLKKN